MRALAVALLVGCTAPAIAVAEDASVPPSAISVETWDLHLRDREPTRPLRAKNVVDALERDGIVADVTCIVGVPDDAERAAFVARSPYPYSAFVRTDRKTPIDDPGDLVGTKQMLPSGPPCTSPAAIAELDAHVACLSKCVDAAGFLDPTCTSAAACTLVGDARCAACATAQIGTNTLEAARRACVSEDRGELVRDGRLGAVLLSRYPLEGARARVFPSSLERSGALSATVKHPSGAFDVLCVDTIAKFDSAAVTPFAGPLTPPASGIAERTLAGLRAIAAAGEHARVRPTVVLGSTLNMWQLTKVLTDYDWMTSNGLQPLASIESGLCTACPKENPLARVVFQASVPRFFDAYFFAAGRTASIEAVAATRTETRYTIKELAVAASPTFGARAVLRFD